MHEEDPLLDKAQEYDIYLEHPSKQSLLFFMALHGDHIAITLGSKVMKELPFRDMIGIKSQQLDQELHQVTLHSFPRRKGCLSKEKRLIESFAIWIPVSLKELQALKLQVLREITSREVKSEQELAFLTYWNPKAGSGSKTHLQRAMDLIKFTNFKLDIVQTTHRGHCQEHLDSIDPTKYQGVVFISGDGLLHQFINSKMAFRLPITHIPGGTGNGISKTQAYNAGEECRTQNNLFLAVKGRTKQFNVVQIQLQKEERTILSLLSFEWAYLADIDISSEFLRWMGLFRLDVWGYYRAINIIRYRGRLSYSTTEEKMPKINQPIPEQKYNVVEANFFHTIFSVVSHLSTNHFMAPFLRPQDRAIDIQYVSEQHGRWAFTKLMLALGSQASQFDVKKQTKSSNHNFGHSKVKSFRLEPLGPQIGFFTIDGELFQAQKMQASLYDRRYRLFV